MNKTRYSVLQTMEARVISTYFDSKNRPFLNAVLLQPNEGAHCRENKPANFIRVYCPRSFSLEEQQNIISSYQVNQTIKVVPKSPSESYPDTCIGDFAECVLGNEPNQNVKVKEKVLTKDTQKYTISGLDTLLIADVEAYFNELGLTRKFFINKMFKKLLAGDFDEEFS